MNSRSSELLGDSQPDEWTFRRFGILLALLIAAGFPDVLLGLKTFVFRDYFLFGYPLAHYHRESFWNGEVPLWNPLNQCGLPFLAQWNTMVLYPLSFIYLLLPLPWSLGFFCLVHLFLAGLGMYLLARRWTQHGLASSVAGVAYVFSGMTLSCLIYPNNIAGVAWMPWVVFLVERGWRKGGRKALLAALVAATQLLAGAPEVFLFTWLILLALWMAQFTAGSENRIRMVGRAALISGLVAALSAAQMLPFLELFHHSQRDAAFAGSEWPLPATGWANLLVPLFRSIKTPVGTFMQSEQGWVSSTYLGAGILVLAMSALCAVRRRKVGFFGLLLGASLILALGDGAPLYPWLKKLVPPIAMVRYPVKLMVVAAFLAPLIAAFGVAHYLNTGRDFRRAHRRIIVGIASLACALIVAVIWFANRYPGIREDWHHTLFSGASRAVFMGLMVASLFAVSAMTRIRARGFVALAFLLLVFLDGITNSPTQNPRVNPQAYTLALPPIQEMKPFPQHGHSRSALSFGTIWGLHTTVVSNSFDGALVFRMGLYDNVNLLENVPKLDGFFALNLRDEQKLRRRAFWHHTRTPEALMDFLSVSQMCSPGGSFQWTNRPTAMPMVTAGQRPEFATPARMFDALFEPGFDPRRAVYLPQSAQSTVCATNEVAISVAVRTATAHLWKIDVDAAETGLLVIAQAFYPAWTARVDGRRVPLWKANWMFQALEVPAGRHKVTLHYEDRAFRIGAIISILTGLGFCIGWILISPKDREERRIPAGADSLSSNY
jgi:hypothetical protein